jgi:hypothetical protein
MIFRLIIEAQSLTPKGFVNLVTYRSFLNAYKVPYSIHADL